MDFLRSALARRWRRSGRPVRHDLASRRHTIDRGEVVMDEMLEPAPGHPAFFRIRLDGRRLQKRIRLRIGVVGRVGKGQPDLEIPAPVSALDAERRIESVGKGSTTRSKARSVYTVFK